MRPESDLEPVDAAAWVKPVRTAVFPALTLPDIVGDIGGLCLTLSAALAVLSAALEAATFRAISPNSLSVRAGSLPATFRSPPLSFWDRLALFTRGGASLTVAVILLVGMVVLALSADHHRGRQRAVMVAAASLASVIVVVDVVTCIKVLNNSVSQYSGLTETNKASAVLSVLAPAALGVAVALTAWLRLTAQIEEAPNPE